jgi:beta-aspartyl-peptidase (threonine type)
MENHMPHPVLPVVVVHGGAGRYHPGGGLSMEVRLEDGREGCRRAALAGLQVLRGGGSALDAAQAGVEVLEADPTFNAGCGAVLNRAGGLEMDASLMEGTHLRAGAVAALPNAASAIRVARAVLEDGEHVLLAGPAAWDVGRERGLYPADPALLITAFARERYAVESARRQGAESSASDEPGTVGACAVDASGATAAATSTGGTAHKRPGRVGDSALLGCGTYADDRAGAASATGHGESIMRLTLTRHCVELLRAGSELHRAAWECLDELGRRLGAEAGLICVGPRGRAAAAHNSAHMPWAIGIVAGEEDRLIGGIRIESGRDVWKEFG